MSKRQLKLFTVTSSRRNRPLHQQFPMQKRPQPWDPQAEIPDLKYFIENSQGLSLHVNSSSPQHNGSTGRISLYYHVRLLDER